MKYRLKYRINRRMGIWGSGEWNSTHHTEVIEASTDEDAASIGRKIKQSIGSSFELYSFTRVDQEERISSISMNL